MFKSLVIASSLSALTLLGATTMASSQSNSAPIQAVNGIAAIVNKSVITDAQVSQAAHDLKAQIQASTGQVPPERILREHAVQQLINQELVQQIAKKAKITVTADDMNMAIDNIAKQNHLSVKQLESKIEQGGTSLTDFKKQLKQQVLVSKVQQQAVAGKVNVTSAQITRLIAKVNNASANTREYHVADILIPVNSDNKSHWANAENRAEDVYKKLKDGSDFAKVAKLESGGPNALKGGDMGWQSSNDLPNLFLDQLKHMKVNGISQPIKAGNGFHILKLLGVKKSGKSLSRAQAKQILMEKAFEKQVSKWLKTLRKSAYIKVM